MQFLIIEGKEYQDKDHQLCVLDFFFISDLVRQYAIDGHGHSYEICMLLSKQNNLKLHNL